MHCIWLDDYWSAIEFFVGVFCAKWKLIVLQSHIEACILQRTEVRIVLCISVIELSNRTEHW